MATRVTVESLTVDLDRIAAGAERSEQWAAAKGAVDTKAKLHGHMIDRKESGAPGDFAGLDTQEAVIAALRQELGDATADAFVAALAARDAGPDQDEALPMPASPTDTVN